MELVGITLLVGTALFAFTYGKKKFPSRVLQPYKVTSKLKRINAPKNKSLNIKIEGGKKL